MSEEKQSEQHAHPVALTPGDKVLVEAEVYAAAQNIVAIARDKDGAGCSVIADPATVHPASVLEDLREELQAYKDNHDASSAAIGAWGGFDAGETMAGNVERLTTAYNIQYGQLWQARKSGDAARRELAEAMEKLANIEEWSRLHVVPNRAAAELDAILARHAQLETLKDETVCGIRCTILGEQPERRKGERRGLYCDLRITSEMKRRKLGSDRRKASEAVDWQAKAHEKHEKWLAADERAEAAEAECERLREEHHNKESQWSRDLITTVSRCQNAERLLRSLLARAHKDGGHYADSHGLEKASADAEQVFGVLLKRAEQAEAKLEKVREWHGDSKQGMGDLLRILDTPPAQQQAETWPADELGWWQAVERRIEALEAAQKARE